MDINKFAHLLARLAYEDDFRQRFVEDPRSTLIDMGIDPETSDVPTPPFELPAKEILQKEYEERFKRLTTVTQPFHVLF